MGRHGLELSTCRCLLIRVHSFGMTPPRLPGLPPPPHRSGSRMRALADPGAVRTQSDVTHHRLECRSALNRNPNPEHAFYWTLNPYRGCEFACAYCYARRTHDYLDHDGARDFEKRIYVKEGMAAALSSELRAGIFRGRPIALGTATDPYQPAERRHGVTRSLLEVLAGCPDLDLGITTKSPLILRDLGLLRMIASTGALHVRITVTTTDSALARVLEPRAPSPRRRLLTVERLVKAGIRTAVNVMPLLPGITDDREGLSELLVAARAAGALWAEANVLFLDETPRRSWFETLARHFPERVETYRRLYGNGRLLPAAMRDELLRRFRELRAEAGFLRPAPLESNAGTQLRLDLFPASGLADQRAADAPARVDSSTRTAPPAGTSGIASE